MRLFLHIGLPRTGTTTLQTKLFQKDKKFIGKVKEIEEKEVSKDLDALSREFVEIVNLANINPTKVTYERTKAWKINFTHTYGDIDVLESDENIFAWNTTSKLNDPWPMRKIVIENLQGRHPFINWLQVCANIFPPDDIKVCFITRNFSTWIASLYSKNSRNYMIANQKDFDGICRQLLSEKRIDVDLSSFYKDLMDILGRDRVFISDMNELYRNNSKFQNFLDFLEIRIDNKPGLLPRTNSYRDGENFKIRPAPNFLFKNSDKSASYLIKFIGYIESKVATLLLRLAGFRSEVISVPPDLDLRISKSMKFNLK